MDAFCAQCGQAQGVAKPAGAGFASPPNRAADPLAGLSPRTASILCYVPTIGWIGAVVVLAAHKFKGDKPTRFHAFQGLYLFAIWLMVEWVLKPILIASSFGVTGAATGLERADRMLEAFIVCVSIFMMVKASHGEAFVLPIVGELALRSAAEE